MANKKKSGGIRPGSTPEARENQMISLAVDCAEKQMRDGTASPSVIVHYLKLATEKSKLECAIMKKQEALIAAKTKNYESIEETKSLLDAAMKAFSTYQGTNGGNDDDSYDVEDPNIF